MTTLKATSGMPFATRPVLTPRGLEAATWTSNTDAAIAVWLRTAAGWVQVGRTTYPTNPGLPHCSPSMSGAAITGARDAVFIVGGCFSGDGSVNAAAIGNGPRGWGALQQPQSHRLLSTGLGGHHFRPASAIHWEMEFDHGRLVTIDHAGWFGNAGAIRYPRIQKWRWRHGGLASTADSRFRSRPGSAPKPVAPALPSSGCPRSGSYLASFGVLLNPTRHVVPNAPIAIEIFPRQDRYPSTPHCTEYISPLTPVDVQAGRTSSSLTSARYRRPTDRRWITAPAWLLIQGNEGLPPPTPLFYRTRLSNPWYVAPSLLVNVLLTDTGTAKRPRSALDQGRPAYGTATFRSFRLTSLSIAGAPPRTRRP